MKATSCLFSILCCSSMLSATSARAESVDFGAVNLASHTTATVTMNLATTVRVARIAVRTNGRENADFLSAGKGTCRLNKLYSGNGTCTVVVRFTPHFAGLRSGAVVLADKSGAVLATTYIHGIGVGVQSGVAHDAKEVIDGLRQPNGVAVDQSGNLYVITNSGDGSMHSSTVVREMPLPSGSYAPVHAISGTYPQRVVAVDGSGNIFVAGAGMYIYKETPKLHGTYAESSLGGSMGSQCGLALDGAGNVYTSDCNHNKLYKEILSTNGSYTQLEINTTMKGPAGLAVDGDGVIYVAALEDKKVYKETPSGDGYTESTLDVTFDAPQGLALDGAGNVYVSDFSTGEVYEETPTPNGYVQSTVASDVGANYVAVDGAGTLYVSDLGQGRVIRLSHVKTDPAAPPRTTVPELPSKPASNPASMPDATERNPQ